MPKAKHDWATLDPLIENLKAQGWTDTHIAKDLGINRQTFVDHLRSRELVHPSTPKPTDITEVHQGTPEHPGTLEGYQEVMEDVQHSVPETPHIGTEEGYQSTPEHPSVPEQLDISASAYPSTPEVHQEMSLDDSPMEHPGVPTLRDEHISTLPVHPGTPTAEDWELWTTIKTRWLEVEKMLADRQALLSTLVGTPGHTQKKTYVFDVRHIALIDQYAQDHRLDLKDVIYAMCQEFFQRRGYIEERRQPP
jgi:hypothetical protein